MFKEKSGHTYRPPIKTPTLGLLSKLKTTIYAASFFSAYITLAQGVHAAEQNLKYTYDTLGRITFVEDSSNGNRDFDFDKAGNRTLVAVGNDSDADAVGDGSRTPKAPIGLSVNGPFSTSGGYICSWIGTVMATDYQIGLADGSTYVLSDKTSFDSPGPRPSWVRAYNINGYSPKAYF